MHTSLPPLQYIHRLCPNSAYYICYWCYAWKNFRLKICENAFLLCSYVRGLKPFCFPLVVGQFHMPAACCLPLNSIPSFLQLINAMVRGSVQHLEELDVSGNPFTSKKQAKDTKIPQTWKQFFSSVLVLSKLNLSNTKLPAQAIKWVIFHSCLHAELLGGV